VARSRGKIPIDSDIAGGPPPGGSAVQREFFARRGLRVAFYVNLVVILVVFPVLMVRQQDWFDRLIDVAVITAGILNLPLYYRAISRPLVRVTPDEVAVRSMYERAEMTVQRADVNGVAWSNERTVCFSMRGGGLQPVELAGLAATDRNAVAAELTTWGGAAAS
jgi:hypothetical protein